VFKIFLIFPEIRTDTFVKELLHSGIWNESG